MQLVLDLAIKPSSYEVVMVVSAWAYSMWEFPKIGGPNIVALNSRILIKSTPPKKIS